MPRRAEEPDREQRTADEITVDAYGGEEQALGWYYHLKEAVTWPLRARCIATSATSTLRVGKGSESW